MDSALPLQDIKTSRTLRVTWILTSILALLPILLLWVVPSLRSKSFEVPNLTEPGSPAWFVTFIVGSTGCVVLLVGQILAFQNRKVALNSRIWAALAVAGTLLLWGYWFYATTTKSLSAAEPAQTVKLTWRVSPPPAIGYNLYRNTSPDSFSDHKLNSDPIRDTTFIDKSVKPHKTYYYVARAVDASANESVDSNITRVVVP